MMTQLLAWRPIHVILGLSLTIGSSTHVLAQTYSVGSEVTIEADIVYGHKDGLAMTFDQYKPAVSSHRGAILFMVSGGWFSKWAPPEQQLGFFKPFLDAEFTVFAIRHGSSPKYTIPEAVSDVRTAVRYIRHHAEHLKIDPNRLGVMGMSAGGHLALMLGTTGTDGKQNASRVEEQSSRVAAVVALVPPTDLRVAVWDSPESLPAYRQFPALDLDLTLAAENSPLLHVTSDDAPALVVMGEKDTLVPPKHGEWIQEAFVDKGTLSKLLILPEAGHGLEGSGNQATAFRESLAWFNRFLAEK